jgi:hypothetical protein
MCAHSSGCYSLAALPFPTLDFHQCSPTKICLLGRSGASYRWVAEPCGSTLVPSTQVSRSVGTFPTILRFPFRCLLPCHHPRRSCSSFSTEVCSVWSRWCRYPHLRVTLRTCVLVTPVHPGKQATGPATVPPCCQSAGLALGRRTMRCAPSGSLRPTPGVYTHFDPFDP